MTALAANSMTLKTADHRGSQTYVVKNAQALYRGGLLGLDANGLLVPWDDTAVAQRFAGVMDGWHPQVGSSGVITQGNTSASPPVRGIVLKGCRLNGVDVAGVTARANIGEPVYGTTDNITDLTLTPTAFVKPIGKLDDFRTTSDMDVKLFTPEEYHSYGAFQTISRFINLATLANGDTVTEFSFGVRGRIIKWWFEVMVAVTTAAKAATLNLEVGSTNLTGGTIALTSANCTPHGVKVEQGSAFTAGMAFGASDTISVEASSVTAFAEGNGTLHILCQLDE